MNVRWAATAVRAKERGQPLVALETSIWCQGLPFPQNLEGARRVAAAVMEEGAVPVVLAVSEGHVNVGLDDEELARWCEARDAVKIGVRDLGVALSGGGRGATTVSACLAICAAVGLEVFVTGGVGGVHRGPVRDVSSDLHALSQFPVCVVSSGVKSVLDVESTLEMLETLAVPVVGFQTDWFPVFYSAASRFAVPIRYDEPREVARAFRAGRQMGLKAAMLVCNPVPVEDSIDEATVEGWVNAAVAEAQATGVRGKAVTPFLLAYQHRVSGGATLRANLALIESNARLGARLACALSG